MSKDQQEVQKQLIQKEKDKIFKKNPKKEFLKSLAHSHPDLAFANILNSKDIEDSDLQLIV